jgi:flavin reductase (DIM6/NTAB) family NADH-FMN oxidoreductase RutF
MQAKPLDDDLAAQTKLALRRLASAVAVVTCRKGQRYAMTATAVNAMSMRPPSMIVCVNRAGAFHAAISRATFFAINILHRGQVQISKECAGNPQGEDRFSFHGWGEENDVPVVVDAQARIICAKQERFGYGSHSIFIGRVTSVGVHGDVDPLIYVDGGYAGLSANEVGPADTHGNMLRQITTSPPNSSKNNGDFPARIR